MKTTNFILVIIMFFSCIASFGQSSDWIWAKSAGGTGSYDESKSVTTDAFGNSYITGRFDSPTLVFGSIVLTKVGSYDVFLAKYDANGNVVWAKSAGGTGNDEANAIVADNYGNIYVTGRFSSPTITFDTITLTNPCSDNIFIVKYSSSGTALWAQIANGGLASGNSVAVDSSGNAYVAGYIDSNLFLAKYDSNGNHIWTKSAVNPDSETAYSVAVDVAGNAYVTGAFHGNITFGSTTLTNAGGWDIFLAKYDTNGNFKWAKRAGGSNYDRAYSVAVDASGSAYVAGYFSSTTITFGSTTLTNADSNGDGDIFLAKYDTNGNVLWAKSPDGTGGGIAYSVVTDASGNIFLSGFFGHSDIIFGSTTLILVASSDIFLTKYNSSGNVLWAKSVGGIGNERAYSITSDVSDNVFVTGTFSSTTLVFGTSTLIKPINNNDDFFLAKLNANTGLNDLNNSDCISLFPNPSSDYITLNIPYKATIDFFTIKGQLISTVISNNKSSIDISSFPSGIYYVLVKSDKGIAVKKFIKE